MMAGIDPQFNLWLMKCVSLASPAYKAKTFPWRNGPAWINAFSQLCPVLLAINWVMQGMRHMDLPELLFRLLLEWLVAVLLLAALLLAGLAALPAVLLAALAAHTASFTLNGQVWVCARYCRLFRGDAARLQHFADAAAARLQALPWLDEAVIIGSWGVAGPGPRSDLDLRLVFPPGLAGWWRTNLLLLRLRAAAFLRGVPLDLYAYAGLDRLAACDPDEPMLLVVDRNGRLVRRFAERDLRAVP